MQIQSDDRFRDIICGYIKDGRACTSCQTRPVLLERGCTYRNVQQLILSARLHVVPGSRVVLA